MAKFFKATILLLVLAVASCSAEAPRFRSSRKLSTQRRFLARQEIAPTPYPSATELKPEVPFEENIGAQEPDLTYGPPDQTYGPPELEQDPEAEPLPSEDAPEEFAPPTEAEEFSSAEESSVSSRLTSRLRQRQSAGSRRQQISSRLRFSKLQQRKRLAKAQRLTAVPVTSVVAAPAVPVAAAPAHLQAQRFFVVNQPFAYTAQFQSW